MKLEVNKWYITKGGYLVHIVATYNDRFCSSVETSPGSTFTGKNISEIGDIRKTNTYASISSYGWAYNEDGTICAMSTEWKDKLTIVAEYSHPIKLPDGFKWKEGYPKLYEAKELSFEECYFDRSGKIFQNTGPYSPFLQNDLLGRKRVGLIKDKPVKSPVPVPIVESETMKKETAIAVAKTAGSLGFRVLNYWFFEPAVNVFRPIVKGVRYAVFLGTIASIGYGYKNPEVVKDAIMSCLPTVSIEAPEILR